MTGLAPMEPLSEGAEENHMLTRVEEVSQTSPMFQKKKCLLRFNTCYHNFIYIYLYRNAKNCKANVN